MKLWENTKEFYRKHKTGIKMALIGVGSFAGGYAIHKILNTEPVELESEPISKEPIRVLEIDPSMEEFYPDLYTPLDAAVDNYEHRLEEDNWWFENRREDFQKVDEVAKKLTLGDDEYYIIRGENPDWFPEDYRTYFVGHYIGNMPSYPPEIAEKEIEINRRG